MGSVNYNVKLDHIGVAVKSSEKLIKLFNILGVKLNHNEIVHDQNVETFFLPLPVHQTKIELLQPLNESGTISKFLENKGKGVHHLSFECEKGTLKEILLELDKNGFKSIYPEPKVGAHNMLINFLHPKTTDGLLIELMERA